MLGFDDWDYPLYGPTLRRRLQIVPQEGMLAYAERHGIRWILLDLDAVRQQSRAPWTASAPGGAAGRCTCARPG